MSRSKLQEAFYEACLGDLQAVNELVSQDLVDIHADNEQGFYQASRKGQVAIMDYLVKYGERTSNPIDVHADEARALRGAVANNFPDAVQYICNLDEKYHRSYINKTGVHPLSAKKDAPVRLASIQGHETVMDILASEMQKRGIKPDLEQISRQDEEMFNNSYRKAVRERSSLSQLAGDKTFVIQKDSEANLEFVGGNNKEDAMITRRPSLQRGQDYQYSIRGLDVEPQSTTQTQLDTLFECIERGESPNRTFTKIKETWEAVADKLPVTASFNAYLVRTEDSEKMNQYVTKQLELSPNSKEFQAIMQTPDKNKDQAIIAGLRQQAQVGLER